MRSVAVSRGAWDCHGHDVIPRLLLAVICCTTGLWWTCLIRHVVLYTLLFLSLIAIYFCQTQIMRASMTDLQMALLIDLEVGSKEDRLFSYKSVLWRWFKWKYVISLDGHWWPVTDVLICWERAVLHTRSFTKTHTLTQQPSYLRTPLLPLINNHLVEFVLMWWQRLKAVLRIMAGAYQPCLAAFTKIAWMLALLIKCEEGTVGFGGVFMWWIQ